MEIVISIGIPKGKSPVLFIFMIIIPYKCKALYFSIWSLTNFSSGSSEYHCGKSYMFITYIILMSKLILI